MPEYRSGMKTNAETKSCYIYIHARTQTRTRTHIHTQQRYERITAVEPNHWVKYRVTRPLDTYASMLPLQFHEGKVSFAASGSGTEVTWAVRFTPMPYALGYVRLVIGMFVNMLLRAV